MATSSSFGKRALLALLVGAVLCATAAAVPCTGDGRACRTTRCFPWEAEDHGRDCLVGGGGQRCCGAGGMSEAAFFDGVYGQRVGTDFTPVSAVEDLTVDLIVEWNTRITGGDHTRARGPNTRTSLTNLLGAGRTRMSDLVRIARSIVVNQLFTDGNHRTAVAVIHLGAIKVLGLWYRTALWKTFATLDHDYYDSEKNNGNHDRAATWIEQDSKTHTKMPSVRSDAAADQFWRDLDDLPRMISAICTPPPQQATQEVKRRFRSLKTARKEFMALHFDSCTHAAEADFF